MLTIKDSISSLILFTSLAVAHGATSASINTTRGGRKGEGDADADIYLLVK